MITRAVQTEKIIALLALQLTPGVGAATINRLAAWLGSAPLGLLGQPPAALARRVPQADALGLAALRACGENEVREARALLRRVRSNGGSVVSSGEALYPGGVARPLGSGAPPLLFLQGAARLLLEEGVGIVGARWPSAQGLRCARQCAQACVGAGFRVVSGAASGIDTEAHQAALEAGGSTVAVLPQGLLTYQAPAFYQRALAQGRLLLVSEFVPSMPWKTHAAVTRNATISALSQFLVVIEAKKTGGSVQTAKHGLAQSKAVYMQPYAGGEAPVKGARPLSGLGCPVSPAALKAVHAHARPPAHEQYALC
jgi:DNA processing protein